MLAIKVDTLGPQPHPMPRLRGGIYPPVHDDGAAAIVQRVASRLRDVRRARGLTLDQLSASSGVSRTALSQIERQKSNPSLASLWKIAAGLGLSLLELVDSPMGDDTVVIRASTFARDSERAPRTSRLLAPLATTPWGQAHEFILPSGGQESLAAHDPGTRELVVVLEGELRVLLGRSHYELGEGDSLVAFADIKHGYENIGTEPARFHLFVLSPR